MLKDKVIEKIDEIITSYKEDADIAKTFEYDDVGDMSIVIIEELRDLKKWIKRQE